MQWVTSIYLNSWPQARPPGPGDEEQPSGKYKYSDKNILAVDCGGRFYDKQNVIVRPDNDSEVWGVYRAVQSSPVH